MVFARPRGAARAFDGKRLAAFSSPSSWMESGHSIPRAMRFADATPSASAWWILPITATRWSGQAFGEVHLPQWTAAVQGRAGDLADYLDQVHGDRQGQAPPPGASDSPGRSPRLFEPHGWM